MDELREKVAKDLARWRYGVTTAKPNPVELIEADRILALVAEDRRELVDGLNAVMVLINESHGVAGLHLNGDVAPWDELRTGGRFEEWLKAFDAALAKGGKP